MATPEEKFDEGDNIEKPGKSFRFHRKRGHLVYRTHIDKESIKQFIEDVCCVTCKFFLAAHETSDSQHAYEHTHVLFEANRMINITDCTKFDICIGTLPDGSDDIAHPFISGPKNEAHWEACIRYLGKQDPDNAKWKDYKKESINNDWLCDAVWKCSSLAEAYRTLRKDNTADCPAVRPADIKLLWEAKPKDDTKRAKLSVPIVWQKQFIDMIACKGNGRLVKWYIDKKGGCGKSETVKLALAQFPKECAFIKGASACRDAARILKNEFDRGNSLKTIIFDIPRSCATSKELYELLECCCDGMISSTKYDSSNLVFEPEHVVVFANFGPDTNMLSKDRWQIRELLWKDSRDPATAWDHYRTLCDAAASIGSTGILKDILGDKTIDDGLQVPNIICTPLWGCKPVSPGDTGLPKKAECLAPASVDRANNLGANEGEISQLLADLGL